MLQRIVVGLLRAEREAVFVVEFLLIKVFQIIIVPVGVAISSLVVRLFSGSVVVFLAGSVVVIAVLVISAFFVVILFVVVFPVFGILLFAGVGVVFVGTVLVILTVLFIRAVFVIPVSVVSFFLAIFIIAVVFQILVAFAQLHILLVELFFVFFF